MGIWIVVIAFVLLRCDDHLLVFGNVHSWKAHATLLDIRLADPLAESQTGASRDGFHCHFPDIALSSSRDELVHGRRHRLLFSCDAEGVRWAGQLCVLWLHFLVTDLLRPPLELEWSRSVSSWYLWRAVVHDLELRSVLRVDELEANFGGFEGNVSRSPIDRCVGQKDVLVMLWLQRFGLLRSEI